MIKRRKTRLVKIGKLGLGYKFPVSVQAMTKVKTSNIEEVSSQIKELEQCGAEIIRLAIKDKDDANSISKIKKNTKIPLVADIHFDYRLALAAIDNGIDKIRLNPGNIYKKDQVRQVVLEAKKAYIPIRVGVNSGSIRQKLTDRSPQVVNMVRNALDYIRFIEKLRFYDIVISLKASDVTSTIEAYRRIVNLCDYPLHLGVTAAGASSAARIKSAIGIGSLLSQGIGDTIRVSLTGPACQEVTEARQILQTLNLRQFGGIEIISCPTCGRCEVDLAGIVRDLEARLCDACLKRNRPLKVAVMGCVVNGPGEAKEADLGLAFGQKSAILFKKGKIIKKLNIGEVLDILLKEVKKS